MPPEAARHVFSSPAGQAGEQSGAPHFTPEQQLAHLAALISYSHDAIFTTDLSDVVVSWNPAAEIIYGYRADEIIGRDISCILPPDRQNERRDLLLRIAAGERVASYETQRVRKDGVVVDLFLTVSPLKNADGTLAGLSTIARDISEAKATRAALAQKQRELQDFFENAVIGLHWVGPDGRILWANAAEMKSLGYTPDEYIGHQISEFHADPDVIDDILQRLGRNEKLHSYEARLRCKDGSIKHVLISSSVLRDDAGRFIHTRCFTLDVTARKLAENALRRTEKMAATGRLAASIAHEINNPLAAVTNLLYLAKLEATNPAVSHYLDQAEGELRRVSHIARRTLGFFKDGTQRQLLRLDELVDDVISIYHSRLEARQLALVRDFAPVSVYGYEGELRQVISNLLLNAMEASSPRQRITVRIRSVGGLISCSVADHGTGVPASERSRIFEPFFTTKQDTGTGLGLWVSREIVAKHGGCLAFKTSAAGKTGTVFRMTLPSVVDACSEQAE